MIVNNLTTDGTSSRHSFLSRTHTYTHTVTIEEYSVLLNDCFETKSDKRSTNVPFQSAEEQGPHQAS